MRNPACYNTTCPKSVCEECHQFWCLHLLTTVQHPLRRWPQRLLCPNCVVAPPKVLRFLPAFRQ